MLYHGVMSCTDGTFQWAPGTTQTLPASFYLSGMPAWWGSGSAGVTAWPPIGPDVTGGDFADWANPTASTPRGHVYKIPALNCFTSSTANGTTNVTTFDSELCYGGTSRADEGTRVDAGQPADAGAASPDGGTPGVDAGSDAGTTSRPDGGSGGGGQGGCGCAGTGGEAAVWVALILALTLTAGRPRTALRAHL
jgi:hypothetical protein